jgi:hypothetical protein
MSDSVKKNNELLKAIQSITKESIKNNSVEAMRILSKEVKSDAIRLSYRADTYEKVVNRRNQARAQREEAVNDLIYLMKEPIKNEQENKIKYRGIILGGFLLYFLMITFIIFDMIRAFQVNGFTNNEAKIVQFLVTGFFVNLIALATVVFKYLFDDKNSLMKDMIQLIVETLRENKVKESSD